MDEAVVADLKQFITGVITQQTSDIGQDIQRLDKRVDVLEVKLDDGFSAIAEILEDMNNRQSNTEAQLKDHASRAWKGVRSGARRKLSRYG